MSSCNDEGCVDQDLVAKLPELSEGKTKHFFISYSSYDKDSVFAIVDEVEKRFGLSCVFDERDFQGGKDISVNILEGIKCSSKVLIFLTPDFLRSGWCKYETDAAFVTSMGSGYSCIVPVLLKDCIIPPTLVTLTYIDATIPGLDVPMKIASTLLEPATDDGLFHLNISAVNRIYENGYCYVIQAKRDNICQYRPAKYRFKADQHLLERLKENRVEVPEQLLNEAVEVLNKDSIMWSYDYLSRGKNFGWTVLFVPLYPLIYFLVDATEILKKATTDRQSPTVNTTQLIYSTALVVFLMLLSFIIVQIPVCCLPNICYRRKREVSVRKKLWRKIGKQCIENNVLLLFTGRRNKLPTVSFKKTSNMNFSK